MSLIIGLASVSVSVYISVLSHNDDTDDNNDNDENDNDNGNVSENNVDNETCKYRSWRAAGDSEIIWAASLYLAFIFVYLRLPNICLLICLICFGYISNIFSPIQCSWAIKKLNYKIIYHEIYCVHHILLSIASKDTRSWPLRQK